jgi:hypothetical protein
MAEIKRRANRVESSRRRQASVWPPTNADLTPDLKKPFGCHRGRCSGGKLLLRVGRDDSDCGYFLQEAVEQL